MAKQQPIVLENINLGGVADSIYLGAKNSVAKLVGWDLHEIPGKLKVAQKMTKDSASVVTELCKVVVEASTGEIFWFSSESGKIWKDGSPYTLAHTTTPVVGEAKCLGAYEYGGFIYWFTEKRGHRIQVNATHLADWSTYASEDVVELNLDQGSIGGSGDVYTLATSIAEGATHKQTFVPASQPLDAIAVHITAVGTGNWTVTIHNSSDVSQGAKTIVNGSLSTGYNFFEFATALNIKKGSTYHVHVTSTVADGTVTASSSEDLEDGAMKIYRTSDASFHPCLEHLGILFIGDRHFVHQIEESSTGSHVFTTEALDIREPLRVKCLGKDPYNLLVGTTVSSTLQKTQIIKWNTFADSYTTSDEIPEVGINAFLPADNTILVHAGLGGNIYVYDSGSGTLELYKGIPGEFTPSATATVHPNAVGNLAGKTLIGVSNLSGNPVDQGVWTFGRHSRDYPYVFDLTYPISERSGVELVLTAVEIGCILVSGFDVYVAYKNGANIGIDKLDYTAKLEKAFLETRQYSLIRSGLNSWSFVNVAYASIPASTSYVLKYKVNHAASYVTYSSTVDDSIRDVYCADEIVEGTTYQLKILPIVSGNTAPDLEQIEIGLS